MFLITSPRSGRHLLSDLLLKNGLDIGFIDYYDPTLANYMWWVHTCQMPEIKKFYEQHRFDKVILLLRRDIIRQAISFYKTIITEQFSSKRPQKKRCTLGDYCYDGIKFKVDEIVDWNKNCVEFLHARDVEIHLVCYEDLDVSKPELREKLKEIFSFWNISRKRISTRTDEKRMADEITEVWYQMFYKDLINDRESGSIDN